MNFALETNGKLIKELYAQVSLFNELQRLRIEFPGLRPGSPEQFDNLNKTKILLEIVEKMREKWI